jgi:precorrin-3B methylase
MKHQQRSERVDAPQEEEKGKWAVDRILEGKPTGVISPGVSGLFSVAHVIPKVEMGDAKCLRNP